MSRISLKAVLRELNRRNISFAKRYHDRLAQVTGFNYDREKKAIERDIKDNERYIQNVKRLKNLMMKPNFKDHQSEIYSAIERQWGGGDTVFEVGYSGKGQPAKQAWERVKFTSTKKLPIEEKVKLLEVLKKYFLMEIGACKRDLRELEKNK